MASAIGQQKTYGDQGSSGTSTEQIVVDMDKEEDKGTKRTKCLAWLLALFVIVSIVFAVLFVIYYEKNKDDDDGKEKVCTSLDCVKAGAELAEIMDLTADPCNDFAQFSCGRFYRDTIIPDDKQSVNMFVRLDDINEKIFRSIMEEEIKPDDPESTKKMKSLYQICMDEDQIEKIGVKPYQTSGRVEEWPTLNRAWSDANFNLTELFVKYESIFTQGLIRYPVWTNYTDSSAHAFMLRQPYLGLDSEKLKLARNDTTIMAYQQYYVDIAVALGADEKTAQNDAEELVDFEVELAKIFMPIEDQVATAMNNPMSLDAMNSKYSLVNWHSVIQAIYSSLGVTIGPDQIINVSHRPYFDRLGSVLKKTTPRAIQNRVAFKYATKILPKTTKQMRDIHFKFLKIKLLYHTVRLNIEVPNGDSDLLSQFDAFVLQACQSIVRNFKINEGVKKQKPRWQECVLYVDYFYDMALSKAFVERTFSESAKGFMEVMIRNLKSAFKGMVDELDWMGKVTKDAAKEKGVQILKMILALGAPILFQQTIAHFDAIIREDRRLEIRDLTDDFDLAKIIDKTGYPDKDFTIMDINNKYKNFTVVQKDFYNSYLQGIDEQKRENLRELFIPFDPEKWTIPPNLVNAFYEPSANAINFPAGILQPTFFSEKYPSSLNYGGIGMVIGHEITHGFDHRGSGFDPDGNLRNWWTPKDLEEFNRRTQCLVNQYSSFNVAQVDLNVNGNATLGENIADNGGLKEAYRAYRKFSDSLASKELPLPGLGMTPDQQFFVSFARTFCYKRTDASMRNSLRGRYHSPGMYRIIGSVQNNDDFARVFNCKVGSPMNPQKKCPVW